MKFKLICCNCGHDDFWINPLEVNKIDNTYTLVKCKNCGILERIHGLTVKVVRDKKGGIKLNKTDAIFKNNIKDILENGVSTEGQKVRPKYKDGTPANTIFINHVCETYDISKGEFPITTLRPIAWKSGIREMMVIYQDQLNTKEAFENKKIMWWLPWFNEQGNIGRAYPYNLESHRDNEQVKEIVKVKTRKVDKKFGELKNIKLIYPLENNCIDNNIYGNGYKIIKSLGKEDGEHEYFLIQFQDSGYKNKLRKDWLYKNTTNPYERSTFGIGYLGEYEKENYNFSEEEIKILKDKWENMFRRCYSENYKKTHKTYDNIFVHQDWHCFSDFLKDVRFLPQYHLAKEDGFKNWDLDKDYYNSNCYSKDTCTFLKHNENIKYDTSQNCYYEIIDTISNNIYKKISLSDFAKHIGVKQITPNTKGMYKHFKINKIIPEEGYVYRLELSRNQLNELLYNLKKYPLTRRHIMSFWNWQNINKKELVECAYETIWTVRGEYLDMILVQRSSDYCTAGHINKIQYVALMMMVARHVGLKPGKFTHLVANLHIYDRHIEQAKELISRTPSNKQPKLVLKEGKTNFYDFTIDDFEMIDYEPVKPQLKFELGI